jgi:hypothetical protein
MLTMAPKSSRSHVIGGLIAVVAFIAIMIVFTPPTRRTIACSPTKPPPGYIPPTPIPIETQVAGVAQDAQVVLDGTVKTITAASNMNSILTLQVERYLKGHGPSTVKIIGYFWICAPNFAFHEGSRAIFFVNGDPTSEQPLQVRSWFDAQDAVVTSVKNSTGRDPVAPDGTYDVLWLSLLVIVVLGLIMILRRRRAGS